MKLLKRFEGKRWFIWALFVIIVGLGGLAAYIYISSVNESSQAALSLAEDHIGQGKQGAGSGTPNAVSANTKPSSVSTSAKPLTAQETAEFNAPLHWSSTVGAVGTLAVTGYLSIKYDYCYAGVGKPKFECGPEQAFFEFTKSDSPLLYDLIKGNSSGDVDDSLGVGTNEFELGCYQKDSSRILASTIDSHGDNINDVTGAGLQAILKTSVRSQVSLKLQKSVWAGSGSGDPLCWSDFKILEVASAPLK